MAQRQPWRSVTEPGLKVAAKLMLPVPDCALLQPWLLQACESQAILLRHAVWHAVHGWPVGSKAQLVQILPSCLPSNPAYRSTNVYSVTMLACWCRRWQVHLDDQPVSDSGALRRPHHH